MSTLRISNIEAKSVPASATVDEKVKITNSSGDTLVFIDGKTSGITTVGINTTDSNITFDANSNVVVTGIITATRFSGQITPTSLEIGSNIKLGNAGVITATTFKGDGAFVELDVDGHTHLDNVSIAGITTFSNATTIVNGGYHRGIINSGAQAKIIGGYVSGSDTLRLGESMYLTSTGLGINVSSPAYTLEVVGDNGVSFSASSNSTAGVLSVVGKNNAGNVSAISRIQSHPSGSGNTSDMSFETRNSSSAMVEHLRIKSDGKVGIQTNVPSDAFLDIASSQSTDSLRMRRISSDSNVASNWSIKPYGGHLYFREGGSTDKIQFMNGGDLFILDGDLKVASGHGIDFSATADGASGSYLNSEVLTDYERGRFEPRFLENGTTDSNYSWRYGQYVKIGNIVHVHMAFGISSLSGNFTTAFIGGLPFTMSSQWGTSDFSYVQLVGYSYASGYGDSGSTTQLSMELNQTHGTMHRVVQGQGKGNVNQSSIGGTQRFAFQFSYPTAP